MLWTIISWLVFGLVVGAIARLLLPGKQGMTWFMTAVLGIVGSMAGGGISWLLFGTPEETFNPAGWIMSVVGAILVLLLYTRFTGT